MPCLLCEGRQGHRRPAARNRSGLVSLSRFPIGLQKTYAVAHEEGVSLGSTALFEKVWNIPFSNTHLRQMVNVAKSIETS